MLSMGAVIMNAHTPDEKVNISSVAKTWQFLKALLPELATDK